MSFFGTLFHDAVRAAAIGFLFPMLFPCSSSAAGPGNPENGILPPCPSSPNCVSSLSTNAKQRVDPIRFSGDPASSWNRLRMVILAMKGTRIAREEAGYLHAEFRSALFGFVDDVEFRIDAAQGRIDVRSASRTGFYDFGVNRRRVEEIRERFAAAGG